MDSVEVTSFESKIISKWRHNSNTRCGRLSAVLDFFPGISVVQSSWGYGKYPYRIWLTIDTNSLGAIALARCLNGSYYCYKEGEFRTSPVWRCYFECSDVRLLFRLEGEIMNKDDAEYKPASLLARNLATFADNDFLLAKKVKRQFKSAQILRDEPAPNSTLKLF